MHRLASCAVTILFLSAAVLYGAAAAEGLPRAQQEGPKLHQFTLPRMGTLFTISLYGADAGEAQKCALAAFDRVEALEDIFSDYRERSEVMRLCRVAVGQPTAISPELYEVLENSLRISRLSGGAFDVTVGPVVQLWREARHDKRLPDPKRLREARQAVGYENVVLDSDAHTAMLKLPNMKIDLGGIAKGYAADQALALLKSRGIQSALVEGGGDIAVGAAPPGKPGWKISLFNPDPGAAGSHENLILHDTGIATSGDAYQFLEVEGRRYSHIVNPSNGMGVSDSASVTVIAPDGMTADALATALSVMRVPDGMRLIESMPGISAAVVSRERDGLHTYRSARFPKAGTDKTKGDKVATH